MSHSQKILEMPVNVTSYVEAGKLIIKAAQQRQSQYVCVANVHMCMEAFDANSFKMVVNDADLVVPDGKPLVWALQLLGANNATQVRGSDLLLHLCNEAEQQGVSIGLYGGTPESLHDFMCFLRNHYPQLKISCSISPPFRKLTLQEENSYRLEIQQSGCQILFVGIGCPKQEQWMAAQKGKLDCVMIGVGAAFDFFSGRKKHAPRWMQKSGLEWLFRLASDPGRLWKRYLKHNPRFLYYFGKQFVRQRLLGKY